ncbi:hypothetical protein Lalb_Chr01g0012211 [Lupinus albus]|uniref:Uncharacterized protein n=1 Tax=Lupinus albus TaxID=3870 RepID=A0A6A4R2X6_LUPAL|nr:hypothetical protein Lalb_Chr01g0012211 [Lupinus albus]
MISFSLDVLLPLFFLFVFYPRLFRWIVRSGFRVTTFRCPRRGHGGLRESVIPTQALVLLISVPV